MSQEYAKYDISVIEVNGRDEKLAQLLLQGRLVAYHDSRYEVTIAPHEILMKALQDPNEIVVFYVHVPYAYPLPAELKTEIEEDFVKALQKPLEKITFVNVGTEAQKNDIQFRIELGGEYK